MLPSNVNVPVPGLRQQRIRAALSQQALADKAGLVRSTVGRIETGGKAHLSTVQRLARALRVKPTDLMQL
jgi:transcriptional regulator with XRE-family HTH domain